MKKQVKELIQLTKKLKNEIETFLINIQHYSDYDDIIIENDNNENNYSKEKLFQKKTVPTKKSVPFILFKTVEEYSPLITDIRYIENA